MVDHSLSWRHCESFYKICGNNSEKVHVKFLNYSIKVLNFKNKKQDWFKLVRFNGMGIV